VRVYVRGMAEQKQTPKWVMGMYIFLPLIALDYVLFDDGWRQWFGAFMLILSVVFWIQVFSKRQKDSST
jgi:uncharacterized membrane protein